ncbi:hypothetical protein FHG87_017256 [Trinorchestia longiramus]|nr:hypothetical protein FHG87_017256 [Trinorchestia longiramus]
MTYRQLVGKKLDVLTFKQESDLLREEFNNIDTQLDAMELDDNLPALVAHLKDIKNLSVLQPIVSNRVDENEKRAQTLINRYPQDTRTIAGLLKETQNLYKKLKTKWDFKEKLLQHSHDVLKFEVKLKGVLQWLEDNQKRLEDLELPESVMLCEMALQAHEELKIILSSRDEEVAQLQVEAKKLVSAAKTPLVSASKTHVVSRKRVQALLDTRTTVMKLWAVRRRQLEEQLVLLQFCALESRLQRDLDLKQKMLRDQINYIHYYDSKPSLVQESVPAMKNLLGALDAVQLESFELDELLGLIRQLPREKREEEALKQRFTELSENLSKKHMNKETIQEVVADLKTTLQQLKEKCLNDETLSDKKNKSKEYRTKAKEILSWMTKKLKENEEEEEDVEEDLKKIKECILAYHQLEKDALVIKTQVDEIDRHRQELQNKYPDIFEDDFSDDDSSSDDDDNFDSARLTNLTREWAEFMKVVKAKLKFFKNLKSAKEFTEQQEALMEWIRLMEHKMVGFLEQDLVDSMSPSVDVETCSREQDEVAKEVKRRDLEVETLIATWKNPVKDPEFPMREEVQEKLEELQEEWKTLKNKVKDRKKLLNQSMEAKHIIRDLHLLDEFIDKNEEKVHLDENVEGGSVEQVEDELRQLDQLLKQMDHYENNYKTMKEDQIDLGTNVGDVAHNKSAKPDRRGNAVKLDFSSSDDEDKVAKAAVVEKQRRSTNDTLSSTKSNTLASPKNGSFSTSQDGLDSESEALRSTDTSTSRVKEEEGVLKSWGKKLKSILADSDSGKSFESSDSDAPKTSTPRKKNEKTDGQTPKPISKKSENKKSSKSSVPVKKKKNEKKSKTTSREQKKIKEVQPKSKKVKSTKKDSKKTKLKKTNSSDDSSSSSDSEASLSEVSSRVQRSRVRYTSTLKGFQT